MSQHLCHSKYNGRPVTVLMGWDRPLQGFFLTVEDADQDLDYVYCNLDDDSLVAFGGLPPSLDHFTDVLRQLGIDVPAAMIAAVLEDGANNVGNRFVRYGDDGAPIAGGA